jgi:hypothetical protein
MTDLQFGDVCRAKCTAPARYFGYGKCLYISAQDNDFGVDDALPPLGNEIEFPLCCDEALHAASVAFCYGMYTRR